MKILKYKLKRVGEPQALELPKDSVIMTAGARFRGEESDIFIWAAVDPTSPPEVRIFQVIPTGHDIPINSGYVDTVFDGPYVWHIMEILTGV